MSRYVITGGTGFVGRALARSIRALGDEAIIASRGRHLLDSDDKWVEYDLKDTSTAANVIQAQPDGIYHLAWSTTPSSAEIDPTADIKTNLAGTISLFESIYKNLNVPIVFVSSGGTVYGKLQGAPAKESLTLAPVGVYGMTKAATEFYAGIICRMHSLDIRIARLSNPYGEEQQSAKLQGAASVFARKILLNEKINIWGDGSVVRDYIHIDDAVSGLIAIMRSRKKCVDGPDTYNIGSGSGTTLLDLVSIIEQKLARPATIQFESARMFDIPYSVLDISKAEKEIQWIPKYDIRTGVDKMIRSLGSSRPEALL